MTTGCRDIEYGLPSKRLYTKEVLCVVSEEHEILCSVGREVVTNTGKLCRFGDCLSVVYAFYTLIYLVFFL